MNVLERVNDSMLIIITSSLLLLRALESEIKMVRK